MSISATRAVPALPYQADVNFATGTPSGTVNVGDWLAYSGQFVVATNQGDKAWWKTSGAGVALDANPIPDQAGRLVQNTALQILAGGVMIVSAAFSGQPGLGVGAYPVSTGSGVAAATGQSGVGATWQTAQPQASAGAAQALPVATVIGSRNFGNGGTGQLVLRMTPLQPDVRG